MGVGRGFSCVEKLEKKKKIHCKPEAAHNVESPCNKEEWCMQHSLMVDPCAHGIRVDVFRTNEGTYSQGAITIVDRVVLM